MKNDLNIDHLLADLWLIVTGLREGARLAEGEGEVLWLRCVDEISKMITALEQASVSETSLQHILYALCALLDETAKGRGGEDDASIVWYDRPLEVKYFGTMTAGDTLFERIRHVLREAVPDALVLTVFQRVLILGFKGNVAALNDAERERLMQALTERVPSFDVAQNRPLLATVSSSSSFRAWLHHTPVCIGLSVMVLVGLWLGLNHWLDTLVTTLLSGSGK